MVGSHFSCLLVVQFLHAIFSLSSSVLSHYPFVLGSEPSWYQELFLLIAENFNCICSYSKWRFHLLCLHHLYCICIVGCFFVSCCKMFVLLLSEYSFFCHFLIYLCIFPFSSGQGHFLVCLCANMERRVMVPLFFIARKHDFHSSLSWQWILHWADIDSLTLWSNEISLWYGGCITCLPVTVFKILHESRYILVLNLKKFSCKWT